MIVYPENTQWIPRDSSLFKVMKSRKPFMRGGKLSSTAKVRQWVRREGELIDAEELPAADRESTAGQLRAMWLDPLEFERWKTWTEK